MAHADYHCCAVCDEKMDFAGWYSATKEWICEDCLVRMQEIDLKVVSVK